MNTERLPHTDSIQELARFWDVHDITDFDNELEEVGERVFEQRADISVPLDAAEATMLREMAKSRGLGEAELVREWVLQQLHGH